MGCFVLLFALISPRLALIFTWLFSGVLERAYDGWLVPVIGFLICRGRRSRGRGCTTGRGARSRAWSGSSSASPC